MAANQTSDRARGAGQPRQLAGPRRPAGGQGRMSAHLAAAVTALTKARLDASEPFLLTGAFFDGFEPPSGPQIARYVRRTIDGLPRMDRRAIPRRAGDLRSRDGRALAVRRDPSRTPRRFRRLGGDLNMNRAGPAHHPKTGPARPCLPTIAIILRRRTIGGQGTNRARGASERGDAMGVASAVAPGLRPAKRIAQPLTNSGLARHSAHEGSPCKRLAGAAVLATGRAVPAFFQRNAA